MFTRLFAAMVAGVLLALLAVTPAQSVYLGRDADFDRYRYMVSLRLVTTPDSPRCGGTLIEPDIVLTAAHCVDGVPQRAIVVVVGADIPDWPTAPKVSTLGHRIPPTYGPDSSRDDIAVLRLASPRYGPTIRLAGHEPHVGDRTTIVGWGCTNNPADGCQVRPTTLQESRQVVLRDSECGTDVFALPPMDGPSTICTKGVRRDATVNRGDSGGPLLVRDRHGHVRQVGVTSLGSDSTTKLYAGFTSIPVEADWIAGAIESLRAG